MQSLLLQATLYLGAALIAVPLAKRLGLGSVLGYLVAGIMIGPVFGLVGAEAEDLQHYAEFGVVMMLFVIGLELEPRALWGMRDKLLGLGGGQVIGSAALLAGGAFMLGLPWQTALAVGLILALSSTAIVLQTLTEKGLMQSEGGRSAFSVLLTQDIAVIPMLALLPLLAIGAAHGTDAHHGDEVSLLSGLPAWAVTMITFGAVAAVVLVGRYLTRPVFRFVNMARLRELNTAFALFIVVSIAALMLLVGLSPALGAFVAGVVLANSEFRHELESDIQPFKGLLLGLFFITVGAGINFGLLISAPAVIVGITGALMLVKGIVLFTIARVFGKLKRDLWLFTLSLAGAGEFGFVLLSFGRSQGVVDANLAQLLSLCVALSMLFTPLCFIAFDVISKRIKDHGIDHSADVIDEKNPIIIAGIGRFGQVINRMVQMAGLQTTVLDNDLSKIELMRTFGFKGFYGDPTRPELLHAAGIETAEVLVVALEDKAAAIRLVSYARRLRPNLHIVARARDRVHVFELYQAGADDIVREMFDSSLRAGRYVLENMGVTEFDAAELEHDFFRADRRALRALAELWDPNIPIVQNTAYVERAKQYNKEFETGVVATLQQKQEQHRIRAEKRAKRAERKKRLTREGEEHRIMGTPPKPATKD